MKQIITRNRAEALRFVSAGRGQRQAFWKEGRMIYRFERLPGMQPTWDKDVGGLAWDARTTVEQRFEAVEAARALRAIPSERRSAASRENGKKGGRPRTQS